MIKLLTAEASHGREGARHAIEAHLDVARVVVLIGHSARRTTYAEGRQVIGRKHQLNLAERTVRRNYGTTHILEKAGTRGVDRRSSLGAPVGPRRRRESAAVHAGVNASGGGLTASVDEANQGAYGDEIPGIVVVLLLGGLEGGHLLYQYFRNKLGRPDGKPESDSP